MVLIAAEKASANGKRSKAMRPVWPADQKCCGNFLDKRLQRMITRLGHCDA